MDGVEAMEAISSILNPGSKDWEIGLEIACHSL